MKKLLYLFFATVILSCGTDDNGDNNSNSAVLEYFFEIELAGEIHKIQGQADQNDPYVSPYGQNQCIAGLYSGNQSITLKLSDITEDDYISGQPLQLGLGIGNPQIGDNEGAISFISSGGSVFLSEFAEQNNITLWFDDYVENTPMTVSEAYENNLVGKISNIMISDLGTSADISQGLLYGEPIQGSYEGVLYFKDNEAFGSDAMYDVPVPIRIAFSAVRIN